VNGHGTFGSMLDPSIPSLLEATARIGMTIGWRGYTGTIVIDKNPRLHQSPVETGDLDGWLRQQQHGAHTRTGFIRIKPLVARHF